MPLNTFDDLSQALQDWMEDDDVEFTGSVNDVIDLGEKRLLRDLDLAIFRRVNSAQALSIGVATVVKPTIAAPDLLIAAKGIWLTGGALTRAQFLLPRAYEYVLDYNGGSNATPKYFAEVDETTWGFAPTPDATYTVNVRYISRPNPLSATNQTNWLSDNAYDILFKAALAEAEKFLKSEDRVVVWETDYVNALPKARIELYNLYGTQGDRLGATSIPQVNRSTA